MSAGAHLTAAALRFAAAHAELVVRGASMEPTLSAGARIGLRPLHGVPRPGDVVVFQTAAHGPVVHRVLAVVRWRGVDLVLARGDNAPSADAAVPLAEVIGAVDTVDGAPWQKQPGDVWRALVRAPGALLRFADPRAPTGAEGG